MKKLVILLFIFVLIGLKAQSKIEPTFSGGAGYITDNSGNGSYQYTTIGLGSKTEKMIIGGFAAFTNVDVTFSRYHFTSNEYTIGPSFVSWGKLSKNFDYCFWLYPGFKIFRDHGHDATQEAWQKDWGTYSLGGANLTDKQNRWFRSYKLQLQYQKNFWSKKTGLINGNISDSVNFKAVNKAYFKTQFEVAVKRFDIGKSSRIEPKFVLGHLYDGSVKKNYFEFGSGVALSFTKGSRYYEPFNLQYRARYGTEFSHRLDVIEFNVDIISIYRLIEK